jgi:glc operon protein GlcG
LYILKTSNSLRRTVVTILALMVAGQPIQAQDVDPKATLVRTHLSSAAASHALSAAEAEANRLKVGVAISIIDESGALLREARMDSASTLLIEYARRKAQTSLLFGAPTARLADDPSMTRMIGQVPNLMLVPGGIEVRFQGQVIGAIGISGAAPAVDAQIAQAALKALNSMETK